MFNSFLSAYGQETTPGTAPDVRTAAPKQAATKSLNGDIFARESGMISTSIDGVGTNDSTGTVQVDKSSSAATVRRAFFLAAAGSDPSTDGELDEITLSSGSTSETISPSDYENTVSGVFSGAEIGRLEVTSFVSSVIDPASAGMIDIAVAQGDPSDVEGSVLVVIFDDPNVSRPQSISLLFGNQDPSGDSFSVDLASPFDDASQDIKMSLGISFGYQGGDQVSLIDVNGTRLTSSAGGQDDCDIFEVGQELCSNGALLTVGGIGDDPENPDDPNNNSPENARVDDELYTLDEFVENGDTEIIVDTQNPSGDDNLFFAAVSVENAKGDRIYVDQNVTNPGDGTSWDSAYQTLQGAIAKTDTSSSLSEIWVAEGTYHPDRGGSVEKGNRDTSFVLQNGLKIYGGFEGGEQERSERDPESNETVLSGEIGASGSDDNSYHVVSARGVGSAVLDGFTVTAGNADQLDSDGRGGGILLDRSSPNLRNLTIRENEALGAGGGLANISTTDSSAGEPSLRDTRFFSNSGLSGGGASASGGGALTLRNVSLRGNDVSGNGGALYVEGSSSLNFAGGLVTGNRAEDRGGGIALAGAGSVQLTNVTFSGNSAGGRGGAILYRNGTSLDLVNSIVWNNAAPMTKSASLDGSGTVSIRHSTIEGGPPDGTSNLTDVLGSDPTFVEPADPLGAPTTAGDFRLAKQSIAINEGIDSALPEDLTADLRGGPRIENDTVDLGPHEGVVQQEDLRVPRELAATGGDSQASLSWRSPQEPPPSFSENDLLSYRIYRETEPIEGETTEFEYIDSVPESDTSFVDDGVENFQQYYYRVTAFYEGEENEFGVTPTTETGFSNQATATPERPAEEPPPAPANFEAAAKANKISLSWDPVGEIEEYVLFRGTFSESLSEYQRVNGDSSSFEDQDVNVGTTYYYQVKAIDIEGDESPRSNKDSAAPLEESILPLTVGGVTFGAGDASVLSDTPKTYRLENATAKDSLVTFNGEVQVNTEETPPVISGDGSVQVNTSLPGDGETSLALRSGSFEGTIENGKINFTSGRDFVGGFLGSLGVGLPYTTSQIDLADDDEGDGTSISAPGGFKMPGFWSALEVGNFVVPEVNKLRIGPDGVQEINSDVNFGFGNGALEASGKLNFSFQEEENLIKTEVGAELSASDGRLVNIMFSEGIGLGGLKLILGVTNEDPYLDKVGFEVLAEEPVPLGTTPVGFTKAGVLFENIATEPPLKLSGSTGLAPTTSVGSVSEVLPLEPPEIISVDPLVMGTAPIEFTGGRECYSEIGRGYFCAGASVVMLFQPIADVGAFVRLNEGNFEVRGRYDIPSARTSIFRGRFGAFLSVPVNGGPFILSGGGMQEVQIPDCDLPGCGALDASVGLPKTVTRREVSISVDPPEASFSAGFELGPLEINPKLELEGGDRLDFALNATGDFEVNPPDVNLPNPLIASRGNSQVASGTGEDISDSESGFVVSPENQNAWSQAEADSVRQQLLLDRDASQVLIEVRNTSGSQAPRGPLTLPGGTTVTSESEIQGSIEASYVADNSAGTAYYIIQNPPLGEYTITLPSGEYNISMTGKTPPPSVQLSLQDSSGADAQLQWEADAPRGNAKISLFYDNNAYGENGTVIESGIPASQKQGTYTWDLSEVPTGEYYVYAKIKNGEDQPQTSYTSSTVSTVATGAPPAPTGLQGETVGGALKLQWSAPADSSVDYIVYATEEGEPTLSDDVEYVTSGTQVSLGPEDLDPGRTYRLAVGAVLPSAEKGPLSNAIEAEYTTPLLNGAPTIKQSASDQQVLIGETYQFDASAEDPDGDNISYSLPKGPPGMSIGSGGTVQWTPSESQVGVYPVQIAATDRVDGDQVQRGDTLSYQIAAVPEDQAKATVTFGQVFYRSSDDKVSVSVSDLDADSDATSVETVTLTVRSNGSPGGVEVIARETRPNSGRFTSTFRLREGGGGANVLGVNRQDTIKVEYEDTFPPPGESERTENGNRVVEARAFYTTDTTPPSSPDTVSVRPGKNNIKLNWRPSPEEEVLSYRVYRGRSSGELAQVATVSSGTLSITDSTVSSGTEYVYRVGAVSESGLESDRSERVVAKTQPSTIRVDLQRPLGSSPGPQSYRLVALPGQVNRPVAGTFEGEAGTEWQAYWDDGSEEDFLVRYDGSERFNFRAGRGFWTTSTQPWTVESSVQTVPLGKDASASIALHDGWNIISNPLNTVVFWKDVARVNEENISPLWSFDGTFSQADSFRTARSGEAYYFFNDQGLDSLQVPYLSRVPQGENASPAKEGEISMLALSARPVDSSSGVGSTVRVGIAKKASTGFGKRDVVAPPSRFEQVSLRIKAPDTTASDRRSFLMSEVRPPSSARQEAEKGHTFKVRLSSQLSEPIVIEAINSEVFKQRSVALLDPSTGERYNLRESEPPRLEAGEEKRELLLALGTEAYIESEKEAILPEEVTLTAYPNPIGNRGTIEYTLPEAQKVTLEVYDVLGRKVATVTDGQKEAGRHRAEVEANRLASGVYFGRLRLEDQVRTQKIVVVR
jgi:fibronectin type 3 domain-containing protein